MTDTNISSRALSPIPVGPPWPLWPEDLTAPDWPPMRADIRSRLLEILGPFPEVRPEPDPQTIEEHDCGTYRRIKLSYAVEEDERCTAWLLVPKSLAEKAPAVLAHHPSTRGTGKDRVVGLQGRTPGSAPDPDCSYAIDLVEAGFVVLAPDVWGDGARIPSTGLCRDTRELYRKHPQWSYAGKITWDCMIAMDVLASLSQVDQERIGMTGHSLGAIAATFTAVFDDRIRVIVTNGCTSSWFEKHQPVHWALDDSKGEINCFIRKLRPYLTPDRWRDIPVHWPEILAMAAPRPFLNIQAGKGPPDDVEGHWARMAGNHGGCRAIYRLLDAEDRVAFLKTNQAHAFPPSARAMMVQWFEKYL